MDLQKPIGTLSRAYKMYATRLANLGITTAWDILLHVPARYEDYSLISKISETQPGETVTVVGRVLEIKNEYTRSRKILQRAKIADDTGETSILWFNQPFIPKSIHVDDTISIAGKVSQDKNSMSFVSPDYEVVTQNGEQIHTGRLVPVYPETKGVSSKWLRRQIKKLLELDSSFTDYLPSEIRKKENLPDLSDALKKIHFPDSLEDATGARERLAFDELFLLQLRSKIKKDEWKKTLDGIPFATEQKKTDEFYKKLPFELTGAQKKAAEEILVDLSRKRPMNRLLQGDVGSGKTVLSALAMYVAYLAGYKSTLMAPTEILANQHYQTIHELLSQFGIRVHLVTSSTKREAQNATSDVYIGTQALLFKKEMPKDIGLVVIDEQQRFGVAQRALIRQKGKNPHFLTMTATPIPRTVSLAIYGDLDVSYLYEMPVGRKPIKTWLVPQEKRDGAYKWIEKEIKEHKTQAFIICPFIEESESMQTVKAATIEFERLKKDVFPKLRLGLLHGKLKGKEKGEVMAAFKKGEFDILVATPLVEVGIDIPNASIMLIEAADRFGLAQLHQLRGRVGRGEKQSYCLLFTESKSAVATSRLKALETMQNGAELAELDLKLRGPGEMHGTAQHGIPRLKVASFSDTDLLSRANAQAENILPYLDKYPELKTKADESSSSEVSPD